MRTIIENIDAFKVRTKYNEGVFIIKIGEKFECWGYLGVTTSKSPAASDPGRSINLVDAGNSMSD